LTVPEWLVRCPTRCPAPAREGGTVDVRWETVAPYAESLRRNETQEPLPANDSAEPLQDKEI